MSIQTEAMLVTLNISSWTARKYDKRASHETVKQFNASEDAGRFNKLLVPKKKLEPVNKAISALRKEFYSRTVPWGNGQHLLASAGYLDFGAAMRPLIDRFNQAADEFCKEYPILVQEAAMRLNGMYNPEDYPDVSKVRERFKCEVDVAPVPQSNHLVLNIEQKEMARLQEQLDAKVRSNLEQATRQVWERLYNVVSHMAEKLSDENSIFRDSLIGNIKDLLDVLPSLNVTKDPELIKMADEIRQSLVGYDPGELRKDKLVRVAAADEAKAICEKMAGIFA